MSCGPCHAKRVSKVLIAVIPKRKGVYDSSRDLIHSQKDYAKNDLKFGKNDLNSYDLKFNLTLGGLSTASLGLLGTFLRDMIHYYQNTNHIKRCLV